MKTELKIPESLWRERCRRMVKLCELDAPVWIIIGEAILLCKSVGLWRCFRVHILTDWKGALRFWWMILWHKKILRKTDEQIEELILH